MKNVRVNLSEKEKLAREVTGLETNAKHFTMNEKAETDAIKEAAVDKFNQQVDERINELNEHAKALDDYAKQVKSNLNNFEIKALFNYLLVKPFEENPFQRIEKHGAIITDLGGQKPKFKNRDNGEVEEEEQFIHVGTVVDAGPECKYLREGDVVMYTRTSEVPVPFYKQGLVYVCETRIMAVVNEGLTKRFKKLK